MATTRGGYQHFCPAARALEVIGGKWSLLIVRDLLAGPRRFSDLRRALAGITQVAECAASSPENRWRRGARDDRPARRLVSPDPQGEGPRGDRQCSRRLGSRLRLGKPRPDEAIHPGRAMDSVRRYLENRHAVLRIPSRGCFASRRTAPTPSASTVSDGSRPHGEAAADLVIDTSPQGWVRFLTADRAGRHSWLRRSRVTGNSKRVKSLPPRSSEHHQPPEPRFPLPKTPAQSVRERRLTVDFHVRISRPVMEETVGSKNKDHRATRLRHPNQSAGLCGR
jgi:HxlR-like helix-turn-helix